MAIVATLASCERSYLGHDVDQQAWVLFDDQVVAFLELARVHQPCRCLVVIRHGGRVACTPSSRQRAVGRLFALAIPDAWCNLKLQSPWITSKFVRAFSLHL